jgi:hypothetical protein
MQASTILTEYERSQSQAAYTCYSVHGTRVTLVFLSHLNLL